MMAQRRIFYKKASKIVISECNEIQGYNGFDNFFK